MGGGRISKSWIVETKVPARQKQWPGWVVITAWTGTGSGPGWKDKGNIIDQVVSGQVSLSRKIQAGMQGPGRRCECQI